MYFAKRFLNFDIIGVLGCGSYGNVLLAVDYITKLKVAIKFVRKEKARKHDFRLESGIQSILNHDNICKLYGSVDTSTSLILIMELAKGMDLHKYLKKYGRIDERNARLLFIQMVDALDYMHTHYVVHRDLKLENVVIDDGNIKICDFGLSSFYDKSTMLDDYCGTPQCAPPEIINGVPYVGPEVDIWCLGIILYAMVHGKLPFDQKNNDALNKHILHANMQIDASISVELRDLIRKLIEPQRTSRIKMEQIMKHPWVNTVRKEHLREIVFIDKDVLEVLTGMSSIGKADIENLSDPRSKESAIYSLIKKKLLLGYSIGSTTPYNSYNLVDLDFVNNTRSSIKHHRETEKHKILRSISSVRSGCFPFIFWNRKTMFVVERNINTDLRKSRMIIEKYLSKLSGIYSLKGVKYIIQHSNGLEMKIEVVEDTPFNICYFVLVKGGKLEFAEFVADFMRFADESG